MGAACASRPVRAAKSDGHPHPRGAPIRRDAFKCASICLSDMPPRVVTFFLSRRRPRAPRPAPRDVRRNTARRGPDARFSAGPPWRTAGSAPEYPRRPRSRDSRCRPASARCLTLRHAPLGNFPNWRWLRGEGLTQNESGRAHEAAYRRKSRKLNVGRQAENRIAARSLGGRLFFGPAAFFSRSFESQLQAPLLGGAVQYGSFGAQATQKSSAPRLRRRAKAPGRLRETLVECAKKRQ